MTCSCLPKKENVFALLELHILQTHCWQCPDDKVFLESVPLVLPSRGKGDYHRLGHGTDDHVRRPRRVSALQGKKVIDVACGSLHCVACTDSGNQSSLGTATHFSTASGALLTLACLL